MEIKATLQKPFNEKQKMEFIVEYNHKQGFEIREEETQLEAWGYTEEEKQQQERERLDNLELTASDVERAIYKVKGMNFEDLANFVIESGITGFDVKQFGIETRANHFVRKHPYINMIGQILGYTPEDMDYLFEHKELPIKEEQIEE